MDIIINQPVDLQVWLEHILIRFGYPQEKLPIASLLARYLGLKGDTWLIIEPIHWEATHNAAMITEIIRDLSEDESLAWFNAIQTFLIDDAITMHYVNRHCWLLHAPNKPQLSVLSTKALQNHSLMPILTRLDPSHYWSKLLTELQMFLGAHPFNKNRAGSSINGVWLYGGGPLNLPNPHPILTDDAKLQACFPQIQLIASNSALTKDSLLLIQNPDHVSIAPLKNKKYRYPIHWLWNDKNYTVPKKSWWHWI